MNKLIYLSYFILLNGSNNISSVVSTSVIPKLGLCTSIDCDRDSDCQPGLLCADQYKIELKLAGYDERKANCKNKEVFKKVKQEVCFDPKTLKNFKKNNPNRINACSTTTSCSKDVQCKSGLFCAGQHKVQLKAAGYDERKANCPIVGKTKVKLNVCFNPKILNLHGGGGGGKFVEQKYLKLY